MGTLIQKRAALVAELTRLQGEVRALQASKGVSMADWQLVFEFFIRNTKAYQSPTTPLPSGS